MAHRAGEGERVGRGKRRFGRRSKFFVTASGDDDDHDEEDDDGDDGHDCGDDDGDNDDNDDNDDDVLTLAPS